MDGRVSVSEAASIMQVSRRTVSRMIRGLDLIVWETDRGQTLLSRAEIEEIAARRKQRNGKPPSLVTVTQAAILLGRPKSTIHAWIEDERMTATDERPRRVRLDELYELDDRMARAEQTRRRSFNTVARPER